MIERFRRTYLTPDDDAHAALLEAARSATVSLHVLIYGFTLDDLGDALVDAQRRGLSVGVVADKTQSAGPTQRVLLQRLVDAGVPVTIATSPRGGIQHNKALLVDLELGASHNGSLAVYGSYNFSASAEKQGNILVVDNDPSVCSYLWDQYREMEAYGKAHCKQFTPTQKEA